MTPSASFTGPFTAPETEALCQATAPFAAPWQFEKVVKPRSVLYKAWQPCWEGIRVGRRYAPPYTAETVAGLVQRMELMAIGKVAIMRDNMTGEIR